MLKLHFLLLEKPSVTEKNKKFINMHVNFAFPNNLTIHYSSEQ